MISLAQVLGFVIGPVLQTLVVPLGDGGVWIIPDRLKLDMYTAAGWINVILGIVNFVAFLPFIFKEHRIATKEAMQKQGVETEKETYKGTKVDYLSAWTLLVAFFILVFNFMLLETLATSLTMDQFAWSKAEALYYMGIIMSVGALLAIITFAMINPLCKWFPETKVMIWGGFFFMVIGRAVYIPWGSEPVQTYDDKLRFEILDNKTFCDNYNLNLTKIYATMIDNATFLDKVDNTTQPEIYPDFDLSVSMNLTASMKSQNLKELLKDCGNTTEFLGCPSSQKWCSTVPGMTLTQFILGFVLTSLGYPVGVTLVQTIFSKILGPRPQGVWMGLMTGSGCMSRALGPVFVTYIYTEFGTIWTFSMTTVMMVFSMVWLWKFESRLVTEDQEKSTEETGTELEEVNTLMAKSSQENGNGHIKS